MSFNRGMVKLMCPCNGIIITLMSTQYIFTSISNLSNHRDVRIKMKNKPVKNNVYIYLFI